MAKAKETARVEEKLEKEKKQPFIQKLAEISEDFQRYTEYVVAETKRFTKRDLAEPGWNIIEQ